MTKALALTLILALVPANLAAAQWSEKQLPAYADDVAFLAIGSDGLLYSASANANGYVMETVLDKYRAGAPSADGFTVKILGGKDIIYLGASCDAVTPAYKGRWVNDGIGLNIRIDGQAGEVMTFRLLSTGLEPFHDC